MKTFAVVLAMVLLVSASGFRVANSAGGDRAITQVVKLLQSMLEKSQSEGDSERTLYAKFKCYCDTNKAEKEASIESNTKKIALLESQIEETMEDTGLLSTEVARLKADMADNRAAQAKADSIRGKELQAYTDLKADIDQGVEQMDRAITTLSDIGADQTLSSGADHAQMMAGHDASLVKLQSSVRKAMLAASALVSVKQTEKVQAFLQGPFTGTYTSQSGEVVGILKNMRDTFKANLDTATGTESRALKAHTAFTATMTKAHGEMNSSFQSKQGELGSNDDDLGTKKGQLTDAKSTLSSDQTFLADLLEKCAEKATEYENRVALRTNEESAIAQAVAILNSDAAFESFGKADATNTGATEFLQMSKISKHQAADDKNAQARGLLRKAKSLPHVSKILALLEAHNPFKVILKEISKMIDILHAEETADDEQFSWCNSERTKSDATVTTKTTQINDLDGEIDTLETTIDHPETGLKFQIGETSDNLEANLKSQKDQTAQRTADNLDYQKNIADLVEAERLVERAVGVLNTYYAKILEAELLQEKKAGKKQEPEQVAGPATWADGADSKSGSTGFQGQSTKGSKAITMLKFILTETKTEETAAHDAERTAQHSFEDAMTTATTQQATLEKSLADLQALLADKEEELVGKKEDLKSTTEDKVAAEKYLASIKNGCDFITTNIEERKSSRTTEEAALTKVSTFLKESPAYTNFESDQHDENLGDCLDICSGREDHVECKACLAKVTVPGYCAGHPSTNGCD